MTTSLPSHGQVLADVAAAEQADGWLLRCEAAQRYLALNDPFIEALAGTLRSLSETPVLEVCAGDGSLAAALRQHDVEVIATDIASPASDARSVEPLAAHAALRRYRSTTVLGSFVPVDSGVDRLVLEAPHVRHYVVLNARLGGAHGSSCLWTRPGWIRTPLDEVARWMICRHDVWMGPDLPLLSHGEAWLLSRIGAAASTPRAEPDPRGRA